MNEKISRLDFLKIGAKTALSIAVVTACGDLLSLGAKAKATVIKAKQGTDGFLTSVAQLKEKTAMNFDYQSKKAILLYNDGEIRAFESICTHKGGPLKSVNDKIVCKWHSATFDPITGAALTAPAPKGSSLKAIKLDIKDGNIYTAKIEE